MFTPSAEPQSVEADKKRLDDMIEQVRAATALRANSFVWAQSMKELGKHIFDEPTQMALVPGEGPTSPVVPIVESPPDIVVRTFGSRTSRSAELGSLLKLALNLSTSFNKNTGFFVVISSSNASTLYP